MDQGQYIEIVGMANATHLRDVVMPHCERRMAEAREMSRRHAATGSPARRSALVRLGDRLIAAGERLRARAPIDATPSGSS